MGAIDGVGSTPQLPQDQELVAGNPIQRAVQSPFGPKGDNYASALFFTESSGDRLADESNLMGPTKPTQRDRGIGYGAGVGENNGKRQYFIGVRYLEGPTPTDRLAVSAERTSSDAPVMNRSVPTLTTTAAVPLGGALKGQIIPGTDDSFTASAVGTRFDNTKGVHVIMAGVQTALSVKDGDLNVTRADTYQGLKNFGASTAKGSVEGFLTKWSQGDLTRPIEGQTKPLPSVAGNPALYSNSHSVGYVHPTGKADPTMPYGGRVTATATFPIDESRVPAAYKAVIDRLDRAQNIPDPAKREAAVTQIEEDLHNSPQLEKGMIAWEQREVNNAREHLEKGTAQQPAQERNQLGELVDGVGRAIAPALEGGGEAIGGIINWLRGGNPAF